MAWRRTALAAGAFSAILLHAADRRVLVLLPGLAGLLLGLLILVGGERRYRRVLTRAAAGDSCASPHLAAALAAGVLLLAVGSFTALAPGVR